MTCGMRHFDRSTINVVGVHGTSGHTLNRRGILPKFYPKKPGLNR